VVDGWTSIEQWWNDIDRENLNTGKKSLKNVGGGWMDECEAMVEWYCQAKTEVLGEEHFTV